MFESLKKKIAGAVKGLVAGEEAQPEAESDAAAGPAARAAPEPRPEPAAKALDETVRLNAATKIVKAFGGRIRLKDNEIDDFLGKVRVSLLQSDVALGAVEPMLEDMRGRLSSADFSTKGLYDEILGAVRQSLLDTLSSAKPGIDVFKHVSEKAAAGAIPVSILFVGPNGTGKTTTIGKFAYRFKSMGIACVISASDTFRAAAIEQTEYHANRIGVPVVKSRYGADPASVAFDAIAYAKARGLQVVLIDSAGRQETNKNLISEMQKIVRVAKPDITIFVGESTAGGVIADQVAELSRHIRIDGIVLTKLDCDARGGNAISIAAVTGIPVLFFGVGEGYDALVPFSPGFVIDAVLPKNNQAT